MPNLRQMQSLVYFRTTCSIPDQKSNLISSSVFAPDAYLFFNVLDTVGIAAFAHQLQNTSTRAFNNRSRHKFLVALAIGLMKPHMSSRAVNMLKAARMQRNVLHFWVYDTLPTETKAPQGYLGKRKPRKESNILLGIAKRRTP